MHHRQHHKPPNNPPHSTTRRQPYPNTTHRITRVESSGPSAVTGVYAPGYRHLLHRIWQRVCPRIPSGSPYRRQIRTAPTGCPSYQLMPPERHPVEYFAQSITLPMPWPDCLPAGPDSPRCGRFSMSGFFAKSFANNSAITIHAELASR